MTISETRFYNYQLHKIVTLDEELGRKDEGMRGLTKGLSCLKVRPPLEFRFGRLSDEGKGGRESRQKSKSKAS